MTAQGKTRFAAAAAGERVRPGHVRGAAARTRDGSRIAGARHPCAIRPAPARSNGAIRAVSGYADRRGPLDAQITRRPRPARRGGPPQGRRAGARADSAARRSMRCCWPIPGKRWRRSRPCCPITTSISRRCAVLGPALWASPAARGGASLSGALYAAPDPATAQRFRPALRRGQIRQLGAGPRGFRLRRRRHRPGAEQRMAAIPWRRSAGRRVSPAWTACWCCSRTARCGAGWRCSRSSAAAPVMTEPAPTSLSAPGI